MASQSPVDRSPDKTITIAALKYALSKMGMDKQTLKDKQEAAIMSILDGKDTMVILPTGYGKSLVYQVAPLSTDFIRHSTDCSCDQLSHVEQKSIAVVISPLIALMSDQVNDLRQKGISAVNVATVRSDEERKLLQEGKFSVVFATPESLLKSGTGLLHLTVYRENVCGIFVDEGHCVAKWGQKDGKVGAFRKKYNRLAELRSFLRSTTPMCCLTATASPAVTKIVTTSLGLTNCTTVKQSPERPNIRYSVVHFDNREIDTHMKWLQDKLLQEQESLPKTLVFCKVKRNCSNAHAALTTDHDVLEKYVAMFHADTPTKRKEHILQDFVKPDSAIRVLLVTSAFGMGVNVQGLHTVIHYSPSRDFDDYFQESGRVGRDNKQSHAVVVNFPGRNKGVVKAEMRNYIDIKNTKCRRQVLIEHYEESASPITVSHDCCDVCALTCKCRGDEGCTEERGAGWAEIAMLSTRPSRKPKFERVVSDSERETVHGLLMEYQQTLVNNEDEAHLYTGTSITSGFPTQLIDGITKELHTIGNHIDLEERFPFFNIGHSMKVWNIINIICESEAHCVDNNESSSTSQSESDTTESELSLADLDSDDSDGQQIVIKSQYRRVHLPSSPESSDNE